MLDFYSFLEKLKNALDVIAIVTVLLKNFKFLTPFCPIQIVKICQPKKVVNILVLKPKKKVNIIRQIQSPYHQQLKVALTSCCYIRKKQTN